jgi:putative PIG3 family NAD(P)H quinone oxidoreductase
MPTYAAIDIDQGRCVGVEKARAPLPPGSLRLAVAASGVNRADLHQRAGHYPPPPGASPILGLEAAGAVIEVGEGVTGWSVGDRAMALLAGGGYAAEVVVAAEHALPIPDGVADEVAAAFPEVFATAWLNLVGEGRLADRPQPSSVLLHAGASGVGTAAIQLCRLLGHASFITAGSPEKIAFARSLGADGGTDRHAGPWADAVAAWRPEGVDVILDPVGAAYLSDNLRALADDGVLIAIGLLGGRTSPLDLGVLLRKRARIVGSTLRNRSDATKAALMRDLAQHVIPAWSAGTIAPVIDRVYDVADVEEAHARMASNATIGALVLRWPRRTG